MRIERYLTSATPTGPLAHPILALGFRPFFLLAALMAAVWLPLWLLVWLAGVELPLNDGMAWHAHEMVFGFAVAVIAGFLLTAVRNWTRLPTPSGGPLLALVCLWVAGRLVMLLGGVLPAALVAIVDLAFLPATALAIIIPIVRARNTRNYGIPLLLLVLFGINLAFHLGDAALARAATTAGVDVLVVFLVLVGGRVIPFFTRNAVPEARVTTRPWLDWLAFSTTLALVPLHLFFPGLDLVAFVALTAGAANLARVAGWDSLATRDRPILWILHVGYLWIAIGLLFVGLGRWFPMLGGVALHALTVGALGTLILGMISRVSLGHTGRPLVVSRPIVLAYLLITAAALARVGLPLIAPDLYATSLVIAASCWVGAFTLFVAIYWRILTTPRPDGAPG